MTISVLMSVYKSEKGLLIQRALQSVWDEQTQNPNQINTFDSFLSQL